MAEQAVRIRRYASGWVETLQAVRFGHRLAPPVNHRTHLVDGISHIDVDVGAPDLAQQVRALELHQHALGRVAQHQVNIVVPQLIKKVL